jgi:secreted trypsin-like serine protease
VLSAAHCIIGARSARVLFGSINRNAMPVQRNAIQINRLNTYNPSTLRDDIALIKLSEAVSAADNVKPVQLPRLSQASTTYLNDVLTVSGFGLTTANQVSTNLQYTSVIGISNADCRNVFGSLVISSILCTRGYPNVNQGSCSGDSGGPLINNNDTVVGIVSFGAAESCVKGYPQGFTRVGSYLTYISTITGITLRN